MSRAAARAKASPAASPAPAAHPYLREAPAGYVLRYVIDASVALKWVLDEPDSPVAASYAARAVSEGAILSVPSLFWFEVANALRFASEPRASRAAWDLLLAVPIETHEFVAAAFPHIESLARSRGITSYDAAYVFLAQQVAAPFITADRQLVARCQDLRFVWTLDTFGNGA